MKNAKSKTKIKTQEKRKTNPIVKETIREALKHPMWRAVAEKLTMPTRKYAKVNLFEIDKLTKAGDTVVIFGKILSSGELTKKVKICALSVSEKAKNKIRENKSEFFELISEIKKNPKAEGIKIL